MTVHAAKGLEFPIVFVVNMGRGTGGARAPIRVGADASGRAVGGDRRLPVGGRRGRAGARTRRDRSACSTSRSRARAIASTCRRRSPTASCRMGRGSLGEVLPASLRPTFAGASAETDGERRSGQRGHLDRQRAGSAMCSPCLRRSGGAAASRARSGVSAVRVDDFAAVADGHAVERVPGARARGAARSPRGSTSRRRADAASDQAIGTLAHRLFAASDRGLGRPVGGARGASASAPRCPTTRWPGRWAGRAASRRRPAGEARRVGPRALRGALLDGARRSRRLCAGRSTAWCGATTGGRRWWS